MTAGAFVDVCKFNATSTGTVDFVVSSAVTGYQTPASAGAVNATVYSYRAESADLTQWEIGFGAYTVAGTTLARTTIVASSTGSKVSFSAAPQVGVTALTADLQNAALLTSGTLPVARINGGTVNQFVQGDGSFVTQSRKLLNTLTASASATLSDTTSFTATFSEYELAFENIIPATVSTTLELQVHSGGTFPATTYLNSYNQTPAGGAFSGAAPTTFIQLGPGNQTNAAPGISGTIRVINPSQTATAKMWIGQLAGNNTTSQVYYGVISGYWNGGVGAVDGFQVLFSAGNITSGTIKVYGLN